MAQYIQQPSLATRIGTGIGQGLAEQIPKEIERGRLAAGLRNFEQQYQDLSPMQRLARLSSIPGITPQMIQSFGDLARQENIKSSFRRGQQPPPPQQGFRQPPVTRSGGMPMEGQRAYMPQEGIPQKINVDLAVSPTAANAPSKAERIPTDFATRTEEAKAQPAIASESPLQDKFQPAIPWTQEQRDDDIARENELHPELPYEENVRRSADNERRYLEAPEYYRKQLEYRKQIEKEAEEELENQLYVALQKDGKESRVLKDLYSDLTGTQILNMKKAMFNDLATNPNLTPKQAAEKWQKIGKDFAVTKNEVKQKAYRDIFDRISSSKKEETLKALKSAQKLYDQMGSKDEFYQMLRTSNDPKTGAWGFGLSPGYAAMIAYPRSEGLKKIIKKNQLISTTYRPHATSLSMKTAEDFANNRTSSDSILAFAREMKDKYDFFDENAFFDYLRENQDKYNFNTRQKQELITGVSDLFRNWGDWALFPNFSWSSVVHD